MPPKLEASDATEQKAAHKKMQSKPPFEASRLAPSLPAEEEQPPMQPATESPKKNTAEKPTPPRPEALTQRQKDTIKELFKEEIQNRQTLDLKFIRNKL